jgi:hypothetical protein
MKTKTGYAGIYCHSDGYETGVGATLNEYYQDEKKVAALIALGDLSYLGKSVAPSVKYRHKFDDLVDEATRHHIDPDATMAYARDRGEKDTKTTKGKTLTYVVDRIGHDGHVYVFEGGDWTHNGVPLVKVIKDAERAEEQR